MAARMCCVDAIRYGGTDQGIIRLLGNRPEHCDQLLPGGRVRMPGENDASWAGALGKRVLAKFLWWKFWARRAE